MIDACVHHAWTSQDDVMPYLSRGWRTYLDQPRRVSSTAPPLAILPAKPHHRPDGDALPDSAPQGGRSGSSPALLAEQLLDPLGVERAVLTYDDAMFAPARANPHLAAELARALNDWTVEQWLARDARLHALLLVANQSPDAAVAEIERLGTAPRIAGVLMAGNGLAKPFGHPLYHPIYAAAAERGLPVVIRPGGDALAETLSHHAAGGTVGGYSDYAVLGPQSVMTHLTSLIGQGVFERFPQLRVLVAGAGVAWLPSLLWRFDAEYGTYRRESPWVKRTPTEYLREHVRLTTHPLDRSPQPEQLISLLEAFEGFEDLLVYGSGYPRWDTDRPAAVAGLLPAAWERKVFEDNALNLFRWE